MDPSAPGLGKLTATVLLAVYAAATLAIAWWVSRGRRGGREEFLLARRGVGPWAGALSVAASWVWAPALFVSAQQAYSRGLPGLMWFTVPNVATLVLFAPLALRIRRRMPEGYTLPQFVRARHGAAVHGLYMVQFLGLQLCSFAVQVLAGGALIEALTGLPFAAVAPVLALTALAYSMIGGFRGSVATDVVQMLFILGVAGLVVALSLRAAGWAALLEGLGGASGAFGNPLDAGVAYRFGIPVTIGLLAGPVGDQMHWQRALALRRDRDVWPAFLGAAAVFACVPLLLGTLGFIGAGGEGLGLRIANAQMAGPEVVRQLLPVWATTLFVLMLLAGLGSTLDSVLCAASALVAVDLAGLFGPGAKGAEGDRAAGRSRASVRTARYAMLATAAAGLTIALIPGLKILYLFLFYGTLRAATLVPTVLSLTWDRFQPRAAFWAVLTSLVLGAPVFAAGRLLDNDHLSVAGSLMPVVLGLGVGVGLSVSRGRARTSGGG